MEPEIGEHATTQWNPWITAESFLLSLFGSYTTLLIIDQARLNTFPNMRFPSLIVAGIVMGTVSCWASHFLNQNSFTIVERLHVILYVEYDFLFGILGLILVCVTSIATVLIAHGYGPYGVMKRGGTDSTAYGQDDQKRTGRRNITNGFGNFISRWRSLSIRKTELVRIVIASLIFTTGFVGMITISRKAIKIPNYRAVNSVLHTIGALILSFVIIALSFALTYLRKPQNYGISAVLIGIGVTGVQTILLHGMTFIYNPEKAWKSVIHISLFNYALFMTILTISTCFLLLILSSRLMERKRKRLNEFVDELKKEQSLSNTLLLSIMPQHIAKRISEGERNINETHDNVTVVLIDITNFTLISEGFSRPVIIETLHLLFSEIDSIARRYGITKIKTIGDCWMGCCGVINPYGDHAARTVRFAMGVIHAIKYYNTSVYRESETPYIQVRIGINSGFVISGVIGEDTFHFDIWGPSANLAAKMEALCPEPNAIQISERTYQELLKEFTEDVAQNGDISQQSRDGDEWAAKTAQFDSLNSSQLHKFFTRRGVVETKSGKNLHTYFCRVLTRQERILDNNLASLQKNRLQAILHARRSFSYVASGVLQEDNDMLRSNIVRYENLSSP